MSNPISADSHNEYQEYPLKDALNLYDLLKEIRIKAEAGHHVPYRAESFISHAKTNVSKLKHLISASLDNANDVRIPANLIFWVYRCCTTMGLRTPIRLPHVCKIQTDAGEKFYVTTKEEWQAHRELTLALSKEVQASDHAKLQYLSRVKKMDIDALLTDFPFKELEKEGTPLGDGRVAITIGDFTYIMENRTCISILEKGMVII